jgi:hypothetical protein
MRPIEGTVILRSIRTPKLHGSHETGKLAVRPATAFLMKAAGVRPGVARKLEIQQNADSARAISESDSSPEAAGPVEARS